MTEIPTYSLAGMALTATFAGALIAGIGLKLWLAMRNVRHVAAHRTEVPEAFAQTVSLASHQKAADYTIAKARWGLLEVAVGSAVLLGWTLLGGLSALNQTLAAWAGGGFTQQMLLLIGFVMVSAMVDLPLSLYQTFVIEQKYGFNRMTLSLWAVDLAKSCCLGAVIGLPIAALILWLMAAAGSAWWIYAWAIWMGLNLLIMVIFPTFVAPLFNKFIPLKDQNLKDGVDALMKRCGFSANGFFIMDGSRRSAHANAYFTGLGRAKRVVFFDTLISKLTHLEVEAVLAHELGHFKHRHILKRIASLFAYSLLGFGLLGWLAGKSWFYSGLGVQPNLDSANDALALLLFLLAMPVFTSFTSPLWAYFSRKQEFEADAYAVAHSEGQALASALLKLYQDNASTLTPDPVYAKFHYSHPPASERISRILG